MEGSEQPLTWPPRPTVEDESPSDNQADTTSAPERNMSDLPNGPSASAEGGNARVATPDTPVNDGTETTPQPPEEPKTPANVTPAEPAVDRVQIVLKDQSGTQIAFGVKSNTRMEKVQNAYADRTGRPVGTLRFYYEGTRVVPEDTVATLEMENEDIIEVMTEQIGGAGKLVVASTRVDKYVAKHQHEDQTDEIPFIAVFPSDTPVSIGAEHGAVLHIAEDLNVFAMDLTLV